MTASLEYTNLIRLLRDCADVDEAEGGTPFVVGLMRDAADAITQLQQQVADLKQKNAALSSANMDDMVLRGVEMDSLREQVADLTADRVAIAKAALEAAAEHGDEYIACYMTGPGWYGERMTVERLCERIRAIDPATIVASVEGEL